MQGPMGLGRLQQYDERDNGYEIRPLLASLEEVFTPRTSRYWYPQGWWGNQGALPHCVAYAWVHWLEDGPVTWHPRGMGAPTVFSTNEIYARAQKRDEWSGEAYDGTSVRAGAKILKDDGLIQEYRWAWDLQTTVEALLNVGPVVVGTVWTGDMFFPNASGFIKPTGAVAGGHAYVLNGINTKNRVVRLKNSWGREWGKNGFAYLRYDDLEELIGQQGEVCLALETAT